VLPELPTEVERNHKSASIMKIYVFILLLIVILCWGHLDVMLWVAGLSVFIPIKYAKDFSYKRFR
jgi:hypothetical protein